jgi:hypothetical protein
MAFMECPKNKEKRTSFCEQKEAKNFDSPRAVSPPREAEQKFLRLFFKKEELAFSWRPRVNGGRHR